MSTLTNYTKFYHLANLLFLFVFASCTFSKTLKNDKGDQELGTKMVKSFYQGLKVKDYVAIFKLFTPENSKFTRAQLDKVLFNAINDSEKRYGSLLGFHILKNNTSKVLKDNHIQGVFKLECEVNRSYKKTIEKFSVLLNDTEAKFVEYSVVEQTSGP